MSKNPRAMSKKLLAMSKTPLAMGKIHLALFLSVAIVTSLPFSLSSSAATEVNIVTTIRPLQLIAEAVVRDLGTVTAIVNPQQSPHYYTMAPSDRFALEEASLLVWIGPEFETYLSKFIDGQDKPLITFLELSELTLHRMSPTQVDPHLWLNTGNALLLAQAIAEQAIAIDSANASSYRQNLSDFRTKLQELNHNIDSRLGFTPQKPYAVYHNAYQYFEKQFGIAHAVTLLTDTAVQPGVQELLTARNRIRDVAPHCLFNEPDSNPALTQTILAGHQMQIITLDLLGYKLTSEYDGYFELLENMAADFAGCLEILP